MLCIHMCQPFGQHLKVPGAGVLFFFFEFVAAAKANEVWCKYPVPICKQLWDDGMKPVAPVFWRVQCEPGDGGAKRVSRRRVAYIEVMQPKSRQAE